MDDASGFAGAVSIVFKDEESVRDGGGVGVEEIFSGGVIAGVEEISDSAGSFVGSGAGSGLEMVFPPGDI